jgi:hypothetical protein
LDQIEPGTPVIAKDGVRAGEVRALYGSGGARVVEFLLVHWEKRGENALLGADEVTTVGDGGVVLAKNASSYEDLPAFDPSANPVLKKL